MALRTPASRLVYADPRSQTVTDSNRWGKKPLGGSKAQRHPPVRFLAHTAPVSRTLLRSAVRRCRPWQLSRHPLFAEVHTYVWAYNRTPPAIPKIVVESRARVTRELGSSMYTPNAHVGRYIDGFDGDGTASQKNGLCLPIFFLTWLSASSADDSTNRFRYSLRAVSKRVLASWRCNVTSVRGYVGDAEHGAGRVRCPYPFPKPV